MQHPNATVAAGGTGVGAFLVWLLGNVWPHASLSAEAGAAIAGAISTLILLIGKHGLKGLAGLVWKGNGG